MVCMTYFCPTSSQRFGRETVQHRYTLGKTDNRFCYGKRFSARLGGGGLHRNVSQILAIIDSSNREIAGKIGILLEKKKNIIIR